MPQFDVYKNPRGGTYPLLLDVQADVLDRLATRLVAPMAPKKRYGAKPISRLNPILSVAGTDYVVVTQELAAVPRSALGTRVTSFASRRDDLVTAIDLLVTGL